MRQLRKKIFKSPENKLKDMEKCDLNDREFKIAILKKLNEMPKKTQTGNLMSSENKSMNKTSTLLKRLKL